MTPASEMPSCPSGKHPYPSKAAARRALTALARHGRTRGVPYSCPECGAWHHTTKPKPIEGYYPRRPMTVDDAFAELERRNRERTAR